MSKKKYRIYALATISLSTVVEASSAEEAKKIVEGRPVCGLNGLSCETDATHWTPSGEIDGEPFDLSVYES